MLRFPLLFVLTGLVHAEVYTLTLRQALDRVAAGNPDVAMARLDEQKAVAGIRVARDPFSPKIGGGSGLAYSSGFPLSIEGAVPSVFQARASQFLFNRQQSYIVAQARENARGAGYVTASKRDEVAFRTASLYLDADRAARLAAMAEKESGSLEKVVQTVHGRVQEGRELPLEEKRADLELKRARQRQIAYDADRDYAEHALAVGLGYTAEDRVRAAEEERAPVTLPASEEAAVEAAYTASKELKRLESAMLAKGLEAKAAHAARMPRVDLVAEYALLAKYNNYDQFFKAFQRHNGQIGMSLQIPLVVGPGVGAAVAQATADSSHLRIEMQSTRNKIALDVHQSYLDIRRTESARDVARADLDFARESLSVVLAQMGEGRASLRQVEEGRSVEDEKWIGFYDAQFAAERARLNLLRLTGDLVASVK